MARQPNILWICTDQQRFDTLGCYGNEFVETPNLDRLAAEGAQFNFAFSQSPVCTPSRAAFLSGRYPRTCRGRQNGADIPAGEILVTRLLADSGYVCGLAGKLHLRACNPQCLGEDGRESRIDDGYRDEDFHWSHHSGSMRPAQNEYWDWLAERGVAFANEGSDSKCVSFAMTPETSQSAWCAEKAIDFIHRQAERKEPWLFSVNMFDPHHSFDAPKACMARYLDRLGEIPLPDHDSEEELGNKPLWHRYDSEHGGYGMMRNFIYKNMTPHDHRLVRSSYWAMCDLIDQQVGRLVAALEESGQRDDTIVIFTSDHGELLGDHSIYLKGPFFYDCSLRVPLIINWPGRISPQNSDALVELVDLPQTLLEAASLPAHPGMMGKSLWPLLQGAVSAEEHREDVYCEYYNACNGHNSSFEYPAMATMIRTRGWKLVRAHDLDDGELYDLVEDPGEHRNLWNVAEYASIKNQLLTRLLDRIAFTADPLPLRRGAW